MNPKQEKNPMDAESLLASALLEIRSDARGEALHNETTNPATESAIVRNVQQGMRPTQPGKAPSHHNMAPSSNLCQVQARPVMPSVSAPALPYGGSTNVNVFSPDQVAAIRLAAAASASFAAAAGGSTVNNPLNQQLNALQRAAMNGAATLHHHGFVAAPVYSAPLTADDGRAHAESIRRDQVEAALKSKPQRGRKREDLSELERLELTRTRNREHAKSTRIRKKARYQELLDMEKLCKDMEDTISLRSKRQESILAFLRAREVMLRHFTPVTSSDSSGEHTAPAGNSTFSSPWEEHAANINDFVFDEGWKSDDGTVLSASDRMRRFDDYIYSSVTSKFGANVTTMLRYSIKGDRNGISLDFGNGGLAEIELSLSLPTKVLLMTGVVRFRFAENSEKLQSVAYLNAMDLLASSDRLTAQISYPSTVSLDPPTNGGGDGKTEDSAGPGMNI